MIVTKAYIKKIPEEGSNIFQVEVPLMEDNTGTEAIFDALLSTPPGTYKGLSIGDAVFVTFEDDQYNNAIILGSLFTEIPTKSTTYTLVNDLKVTDAASLPPNTRFGDYTAQDIMNLYNKGGGAGTITDDDLKQYVQWINTETTTSEGDIIDVYADKIRVMSGQEYDALIEELGSEGVEEDINFINTLHFLWSIPGTAPTGDGGDDEGGGESSEGGEDDKEYEPTEASFQALVNRLKKEFYSSNFDTAEKLSDISGVSLNKWYTTVRPGELYKKDRYYYNAAFITCRINTLLNNKSTQNDYIHWMDTPGTPGLSKYGVYSQLCELLPKKGGDRKAGEWAVFDSNENLQTGDILVFMNGSIYSFCAVYIGNVADTKNVCMCGDCFDNKSTTSVKTTLKTIKEIFSLTSTTSYKISRYMK